ncbi:MAG: TlpA family protein disulfide reductase [Thermodesulfobacteriota bacterium]
MARSINRAGKPFFPLAAIVAAVLLLAVAAGCGRDKSPEPQQTPQERPQEQVYPFKVVTFDNSVFTLDSVKGKPVVLNFWASWCGPCKLEAPTLQRAYETFGPYGVEFIGVAVDDTEQGAREFVKRFGLTFRTALDSTGEIMSLYRIYGVPKTYIIGKDGKVAYTHSGAITGEVLAREIKKVM